MREARRDVGGISREQLEEIYESVKTRISGVDPEAADVGLAAVVGEINVHDLLPTLAANAANARRNA